MNITAFCGLLRRLSFFRRYQRVENESHRDHCGSPQCVQQFHSQKTDQFSRTNMRFLGMTKAAVSRLCVSDVLDQLDYNGFPFRKSQPQSNFPLGGYGIRRIQFHFPLAGRKPSPQSTRIRSPDKTRRIRITVALPFHHESLPPHPGIFCNIAFDHLITDYAANCVLQQERFEHRVQHRSVVGKFFSKVLKYSKIFRFGGHCILKNPNLSIRCYSIMGQNMGQTVLREIAENFSEPFYT